MKISRAPAQPYITRDGSEIRELMHPAVHVENTGTVALTFLCMCAPAYVHTDTELTDTAASASFPHGGK